MAPTTLGFWNMVDLLGCELGVVEEAAPDEYQITLGERVADTLRTMNHGRFTTALIRLCPKSKHSPDLPDGANRWIKAR